ncbi:unnamed protein product [Oikopleura dioica]|uniref:Uncharacterized protein n=1 Tax=Oikopleura dioica TaxID=34765 RepID=E4YC64_OIKDI|nr:unnamed protein product [Oikopleura dioica]
MKFFRTDLTSIQPANHTRRTPITAEELEGHATMSAIMFDDAVENTLSAFHTTTKLAVCSAATPQARFTTSIVMAVAREFLAPSDACNSR